MVIDITTLDDNDGNLNNGTPNYFEIAAGFAVHGFDFELLLDFQFPAGTPFAINPFNGVDFAMNVSSGLFPANAEYWNHVHLSFQWNC